MGEVGPVNCFIFSEGNKMAALSSEGNKMAALSMIHLMSLQNCESHELEGLKVCRLSKPQEKKNPNPCKSN